MPPPTNWRDFRSWLISKESELCANIESRKRILPKLVEATLPHGLARSFVLAPIDLLHVWIAGGAAAASELTVYAGAPMLRLVSELGGSTERFAPHSWMRALSYRSMLRGLGSDPSGESVSQSDAIDAAMLRAAARRMEDLPASWRTTGAWMCIAVGVLEDFASWDGGGPLHPKSELGDLPKRELRCLARAVAELKLGGGDLRAVKEKLHWILAVFLDEIEAESAEWDALWWACKVWLVEGEGHDAHDLGQPFSRLIEGLP